MVAPLGSSFMAAFSVQPPGVHFDPPARVSLPNLGAEPGSEVDVFSFDHDVFEFIKTGVASIEPDGSLMRSAPGLGIFESGWGGCVTPPVPNGNSCGFSTCLKCGPDGLEPRCDRQCETCDGKSAPLQPIVGEDGSLILAANKAACEPKELPDPKITVDGKEVEEGKTFYIGLEQEVEFAIKNGAALSGKCGELEYAWSYPVGMTDDGASFKAEFDKPGSKTINLTVSCKDCSSVDPVMASVDVEVVDFMIGGKFKIIENETDMTIETKDDKKFLRGFGGFRLKLEVGSLPAALKNEVKKYTWSEDKGKFFDGFGIKAKEISGDDLAGPMKTEIHWQGPWKVTMDIDVELELELNDGRKVKGKRRIENRVVVPTNKGDDVKIMTSYLRLMGFAAGPASDKTGTYGVNGSLSVTDTYTGDIRMAVIRMQKRDQISRDGKVGDEGLGRIEEHWKDYQTAYDAFSSDGKVLVTHPMFEDWLDAGLVVLNRSYTDALHTTLGGGSRKDLLRAWVKKEGGVGHWGTKVDYRVTLGAWDNRGSIGFSQIQNRYKYGDETKGDRSPGLKNVNLYHPKEAVEAIALWAVTPGLGPSFFKAFERKDWKHSTTWAVDEYPRVGKSTTPRAGTTFEDGVKEQLGKGLAGYNQGAGKPMHGFFRDNTWPEMLRDIVPKPPATVTQTDNELIAKKAIRYGITIQEAGMVSSVSYDWTDSVAILAGTDKKCASSATGDDIELATGDVDNENVVCVCAGPDKTLNSTRNAADEILEFEFVYGEVKWKAKKNWQDERNTAFDAKVAAISLNCMTPPATP